MQLNLSTKAPDLPKHKCLVLGIFSDEKPPRGICGFVDWRLNGLISREIKLGRITGDFKEKIAIPFPGRIGAEMLILFGLGSITDIDYDRVYNSAIDIAGCVDKMLLKDFAFDLPGAGRSELTIAGTLEAMVTGLFDYLSEDIEKLSSMSSCIVASPQNMKEIAQGISQFNKNVRHLGSVDTSALDNCFA
jgi:hypothetical protein